MTCSVFSGSPREVVAVIDPYGTGAFVQESTTNDRSPAANLDLLPIPDVQLDPPIAEPPKANSGDAVLWYVGNFQRGRNSSSGHVGVFL
jgi:hypothetical protein